jgi:Chitinase class I
MDRTKFFAALRSENSVFGGSLSKEQVAGIEGILDAMLAVGDGQAKTLAYALATAYHETGRRMVPVREGFASTDEGAVKAVAALARKRGANSAPAKYGRPAGPHGKCYYGRGHVQLTWHENYLRCSADAGVDLERDPDAMLDPVISARILIRGLIDGRWNGKGRGIAHYLPADGPDNLQDARRTVNVTDKWDVVGRHYAAFLEAIDGAGGWRSTTNGSFSATRAHPAPAPRPRPPVAPPTASASVAEWLAACPGDPRAVGKWLSMIPGDAIGPAATRD